MSRELPKQDAEDLLSKQANKRFQVAKEGRKYEIDKFWQRSAFFWVFIAASFVAFAKSSDGVSQLLLACFGLVSSLAWTLQNRGSKYWQEAWEQKVERFEEAVLGEHVFKGTEKCEPKGFWGAAKFSVSKLTIALSDFVTLLWFGLALHASHFAMNFRQLHRECIYNVIFAGTLLYCLVMCFCALKTSDDKR